MSGKLEAAGLALWGLVLLYAAWKPDSIPGVALVGPSLITWPWLQRARRIVCACMGFFIVAISSILSPSDVAASAGTLRVRLGVRPGLDALTQTADPNPAKFQWVLPGVSGYRSSSDRRNQLQSRSFDSCRRLQVVFLRRLDQVAMGVGAIGRTFIRMVCATYRQRIRGADESHG